MRTPFRASRPLMAPAASQIESCKCGHKWSRNMFRCCPKCYVETPEDVRAEVLGMVVERVARAIGIGGGR